MRARRAARGHPAMANPSGCAVALDEARAAGCASGPLAAALPGQRHRGGAHRRQRAKRAQARAERHAEIRGAILARGPRERWTVAEGASSGEDVQTSGGAEMLFEDLARAVSELQDYIAGLFEA